MTRCNDIGCTEHVGDVELSSPELLTEWCRQGWRYRRIGARPQKEQDWYASRVEYELGMILDKDFSDFFLATSDMVRHAKDQGIPMGPGRGSVAASVVAWLLRITEVDPIRYPQLLFERFIDVTRTDPPDIDLDISDERRHEVREYMEARYGPACVGTVANFVRYRGKNSLQDIARVYRVPIAAKEIVTNLIIERSGGDSRFDATLADTFAMFPAAAAVLEAFPDLAKATRLEGNLKTMSIHAAGLIVANTPLTDLCAVYERDGRSVLSIDKYDVEYAGALKMDILGLTTMGIIARCLDMTGLTLEDLYAIPDDDKQALGIFKRGDVTGVFQFEGRATRLVNRDVSPDNFGEAVDINALSRPGPLFSGTTAEYCDVKHGRRDPERFHEVVDDISRYTRGQIIYQEQVLRVVREIGGFGWEQANAIRRIIAKKHGEASFNLSKQDFLDGAATLHGMKPEVANKIWARIVTSSTYAFVYAHSVSYSILGLWCAWLKAHHPIQFYAASLAKTGDEEQRFKLMRDARAHGIEIKPPQWNVSRRSWTPHGNSLVAGWQEIPGIGEKTAVKIEEFLRPLALHAYEDSDWGDLIDIPGIGPKTIDKMRDFSNHPDPFGLEKTGKIMRRVREWLKPLDYPQPTHDGNGLAAIEIEHNFGPERKWIEGPEVVYLGIVKERAMQDTVENIRSRTGQEVEDILAELYRPDLVKYAHLRCFDETTEEVYLRVNRFKYPNLRRKIERIVPGHHLVLCVGNRIAAFGTSITVRNIYVIDPD
jgi:DNA polymerase-3 subunit alpha